MMIFMLWFTESLWSQCYLVNVSILWVCVCVCVIMYPTITMSIVCGCRTTMNASGVSIAGWKDKANILWRRDNITFSSMAWQHLHSQSSKAETGVTEKMRHSFVSESSRQPLCSASSLSLSSIASLLCPLHPFVSSFLELPVAETPADVHPARMTYWFIAAPDSETWLKVLPRCAVGCRLTRYLLCLRRAPVWVFHSSRLCESVCVQQRSRFNWKRKRDTCRLFVMIMKIKMN